VLCLDAQGNQLRAKGSTNVVLLYRMLDLSDPERQVAFHEDRENLVTDRLEPLFTRTLGRGRHRQRLR
jgi:hypothetical protein